MFKISVALKMDSFPEMISAANSLKREMKDNNWWEYKNMSYYKGTLIIHPMLSRFAIEPYTQWVATVGIQTILDTMKQVQQEFDALVETRNSERRQDD